MKLWVVIGTGEKVSEDTMVQLLAATGATLDEDIIEHAAYDRLVDSLVSGAFARDHLSSYSSRSFVVSFILRKLSCVSREQSKH